MPHVGRGPVLAALGSAGIAAAVALLLIGPSLTLLPADQQLRQVSTGRTLVVFDPGTLSVRVGVQGELVTLVDGRAAPNAGTTVYRMGSVLDDGDGALLAVASDTVCLDRTTQHERPCPPDVTPASGTTEPASGTGGTTPVGLQPIVFPRDTGRHDVPVGGVPVADSPDTPPARWVRDVTLDGLDLYEFSQTVPPAVVGRRDVPGRLAGAPSDAPVTADLLFGTERVFWVEPVSGTVVVRSERPLQVLRGPDGRTGPPLLTGLYRFDDATVAANVTRADDRRTRIVLIRSVLPATLGVVGAALLVTGAILTLRRPRRTPRHRAEPPVPAPV